MAETCPCGLNLNIWQNPWNHQTGCPMQPVAAEGTDELREALLTTLVRAGVWPLAVAERSSDALLAGPLAHHGPGRCVSVEDANRVLAEERAGRDALLAKVQAVEALADEADLGYRGVNPGAIRRALDGDRG